MIALATSIVVFAVTYVVLGGHTTTGSIGAFLAGAIPNWILNRRWAWKIDGAGRLRREVVAYIAISGVVLAASSSAPARRRRAKANVTPHHGIRVILVTGAYVSCRRCCSSRSS